MDGLHVRFARQDVVGVKLEHHLPPIKLRSMGWRRVSLWACSGLGHGEPLATASTTLDATAGQSVMVDAETVTLSSGSTVDVTSAEVVKVQSATVDVQAETAMAVASGLCRWHLRQWTWSAVLRYLYRAVLCCSRAVETWGCHLAKCFLCWLRRWRLEWRMCWRCRGRPDGSCGVTHVGILSIVGVAGDSQCAGGSGQRGQCVCGRGGIVGDSACVCGGFR